MNFQKHQTIAEIVRVAPATARAFERLGIDYCCRGKEPLETACERVRMPVDQVLAMLASAAAERTPKLVPDTLEELLARIVDEHHAFTRAELERLSPLWQKVLRVHGQNHPELAQVAEVAEALSEHLLSHMLKEEGVLFPAIRTLAAGNAGALPFPIEYPLAVMDAEHEQVGAWLERLSALTRGYTPPDGACGSYRALYAGLADLQADIHEHVYLENHVLFPLARTFQAAAE